MIVNRLFHSCYGACPIFRFLIPAQYSNDDAQSLGASDCLEMSEMGSVKHDNTEMEVFNPVDGKVSNEPFDPAVDHFRILSQYSPQKKLLIIGVVEVAGQSEVARCHGAQVRVALLADKVIKKQTLFVNGPLFKFNETFAFKMEAAQLEDVVVRFRLYKKRLPKRSQLVGESFLKGRKIGPHSLHVLKIREPISFAVQQQSQLLTVVENGNKITTQLSNMPNSLRMSTRSEAFVQSRGKTNPKLLNKISKISAVEVLVSLAYSEVHNTFRVGLEKVLNMDRLLEADGKFMDSFFQLIVRSNGVDLCRHRTKLLSYDKEMILEECVVVPVTLRDLHSITVIVGFICIQGLLKKRTLLGWLRLGMEERENADSAEHFSEMINDIGRSVERWHTLKRPKTMTL
ncbi:C2 domain-containing protein [Aphelenchoides besseyi]|nr:C2 domain-containing protein [Aphelenchoides besseyi]KAI6202245.1 C2 domain-containing protein [Aphelenchoides besseyi]